MLEAPPRRGGSSRDGKRNAAEAAKANPVLLQGVSRVRQKWFDVRHTGPGPAPIKIDQPFKVVRA
jgi:hypothetical protein